MDHKFIDIIKYIILINLLSLHVKKDNRKQQKCASVSSLCCVGNEIIVKMHTAISIAEHELCIHY